MQNWRKYRNFRRYKNADGSYTYIITVDGEKVEVSKELYREYASASRKMEYMEHDLKRDRVLQDADGKAVLDGNGQPVELPEREVSLDKLIDEDWDYPSFEPSPEDVAFAFGDLEHEELRRCIALLTDDEQALIHALFFEDMTEEAYAEAQGITRQGVNKRKLKILKKIKSLWGKGC